MLTLDQLDPSVFLTGHGWVQLLTLTVLEIVLGIDNIIVISILSGELPKDRQRSARRALFERGDEHILIGHNDDTRMPYYIAQLARGFAYDGIEGIDSLKLEASKFLSMSRPDGATSAEIPLAAKKLATSGRYAALIGSPGS